MKPIPLACALLWLYGCAAQPPVERKIAIVCNAAPTPDPVKLRGIEYSQGVGPNGAPLMCLTGENYINSAYNLQAILLWAKQQKAIVKYYQDCIESIRNQLEPATKGEDNGQVAK